MFLPPAVELRLSGRQTTCPGAGPVRSCLMVACPAPTHRGIEPSMACRFGNPIALCHHEAHGFTLQCCGIGLALLCHHGTPPVPILSRFSKCPFLVNHNNI